MRTNEDKHYQSYQPTSVNDTTQRVSNRPFSQESFNFIISNLIGSSKFDSVTSAYTYSGNIGTEILDFIDSGTTTRRFQIEYTDLDYEITEISADGSPNYAGGLVAQKDYDTILITYTDSTKTTLDKIEYKLSTTVVRTWTYTEPTTSTEQYVVT